MSKNVYAQQMVTAHPRVVHWTITLACNHQVDYMNELLQHKAFVECYELCKSPFTLYLLLLN